MAPALCALCPHGARHPLQGGTLHARSAPSLPRKRLVGSQQAHLGQGRDGRRLPTRHCGRRRRRPGRLTSPCRGAIRHFASALHRCLACPLLPNTPGLTASPSAQPHHPKCHSVCRGWRVHRERRARGQCGGAGRRELSPLCRCARHRGRRREEQGGRGEQGGVQCYKRGCKCDATQAKAAAAGGRCPLASCVRPTAAGAVPAVLMCCRRASGFHE